MINRKVLFLLIIVLVMCQAVVVYSQDAKTRYEILNLIRKEKFDKILPGAMRDNGIDMWIHVMREGNPDPLSLDLGGCFGYFIF